MQANGYKENTIRNAYSVLRQFSHDFHQTTQDDILEFISQKGLKALTLQSRFNILKSFYAWLESESIILLNPMKSLNTPKLPKLLPSRIMSVGETTRLLETLELNPKKPLEFRDRVMCEVMYNCSLRRSEVVALNLNDYEPSTMSLRITKSKTGQGRIIPIGTYTRELLERYIHEIRKGSGNEALFQSRHGKRLNPHHMTILVAKLRKNAGIRTKASSHSLRKSSATHLLRNKAPLRTVQSLLGHKSILSTQYYTKVSAVNLFQMHRAHHPREKEKRLDYPHLTVDNLKV